MINFLQYTRFLMTMYCVFFTVEIIILSAIVGTIVDDYVQVATLCSSLLDQLFDLFPGEYVTPKVSVWTGLLVNRVPQVKVPENSASLLIGHKWHPSKSQLYSKVYVNECV